MSARSNALNVPNDVLLRAYTGSSGGGSLPPNGCINGSMNVNQRGQASYTIANQGGGNTLDGWYVTNSLGGGTPPTLVVSQVAGPTLSSHALQVAYGTGQGGGYWYLTQTFPASVVAGWQGQSIGVALSAITSSGSIYSTGGNNGFNIQLYYSTNTTDTNLISGINLTTNASGETALNTPNFNNYLVPTTSWTQYTNVSTTTLPSNATQVMVAIVPHINGPQTAASVGTIAFSNIYVGPTSSPAYNPEPLALEMARCQQFYQTTYPQGIVVPTANSKGFVTSILASALGSGYGYHSVRFPVPMLYTPRVTTYSMVNSTPNTGGYFNGNNSSFGDSPTGTTTPCLISPSGFAVYNNTAGSFGPGMNLFHYAADCSFT